MDQRGGNSFTNWVSFTPEHEAFKQVILQAPLHVIVTMRSKQDYILQANDKGKQMPKKVGLAPIQRDQIDYEFTVVFDVQMDHKAVSSKDRTGLFNEKVVDLANLKTAEAIQGWLESGVEAPQNSSAEPDLPTKNIPNSSTANLPTQPPIGAPAASQGASHGQDNAPEFTAPDKLIVTIKSVKLIDGLPAKPAIGEVPAMKAIRARADVEFLGQHNGVSRATCFKGHLFPLLKESTGLECVFQIAEKDSAGKHYINIEDVIFSGGIEYTEGKPLVKGDMK
jgi:hypothetical protein